MKNIFVTGGSGSIGSELSNQLSLDNKVIVIGHSEGGIFEMKNIIPEIGNIRDYFRMEELFEKYRPDVVFHTAAYKHISS